MKTGLGIRPELFDALLSKKPNLGFLEAHSENYFQPSIGRAKLLETREHYPISLHGVGLSLGRADALDPNHLAQLKMLMHDVEPLFVSEHLAWSAYSHRHLPDLLPLPLTAEAFTIICDHINQMQEALGRQILLENPSNYLLFDQLQIPETEFLNAVADKTGCGLLLDVNNIYVSARNLERSPTDYLSAINSQHIKQFHLAGHVEKTTSMQTLLIDTHNQPVATEVWELFDFALHTHGQRPTLIEWDSDFPEFDVLLQECHKAEARQQAADSITPTGVANTHQPANWPASDSVSLGGTQENFLTQVIEGNSELGAAVEPHRPRISVYQNNAFGALNEYLEEVYPATKGLVGEPFFKQMCTHYVRSSPPKYGNIYHYGEDFTDLIVEFEGLQDMPYILDLMAFEWAIHKAYFADPEPQLQTADYEQAELLQLPVELNSSVWFAETNYPIYEIRRQSLPSFEAEVSINLSQSRDALLVFKREHVVELQVIEQDTARFLSQLQKSENLLQAIECVSGSISPEALSSALAMIFDLGLLTSTTKNNSTNNN